MISILITLLIYLLITWVAYYIVVSCFPIPAGAFVIVRAIFGIIVLLILLGSFTHGIPVLHL
jgi:hypothetical protein